MASKKPAPKKTIATLKHDAERAHSAITKPLAAEHVERAILLLRGHRVMLDEVLADMYGVPVKVLNQAVKRNIDRFPDDFMFQLNAEEAERLRSQIAISNIQEPGGVLRSQIVTLKPGGSGKHRKYLPYAFTEQGVAMLSTVLRSRAAVHVNIEIMRAFVRLRQMLQQNVELARKLATLEKKYDAQFNLRRASPASGSKSRRG